MEPLKTRLLARNRKTAKRIKVDDEIEVELIKPTIGDRLKAMEEAQAAGEVDGEGKPKEGRKGALFAARLMTLLMYRDGHPIFKKDEAAELIEQPWFEDVAKEMSDVFSPNPEAIRGN
jgi:hypothetical protein